MSPAERRALVVSSTGGLGEAIARGLAADGVRVAVTGRRGDRARAIADELPGAVGLEVDLREPGAPARLADRARDALGALDVLVLNGPGPRPSTAAELDVADQASALQDLLVAQQELVARVLPGMRERGWGRIVAVGSSGVATPLPGLATSNIGRWALAGYLKTLAAEVAADGVTVNTVLPGRIATERVAGLDAARATATGTTEEDVRAASQAAIPMGRYGTPAEFAAPVVFLASAGASYVTGVALRCDGGMVRGL